MVENENSSLLIYPQSQTQSPVEIYQPPTHHAILQRIVGGGFDPIAGGAAGNGVRPLWKQRQHALRLQPQRHLPPLPRVAPPSSNPRRSAGSEAHVRPPLLSSILHRENGPYKVRILGFWSRFFFGLFWGLISVFDVVWIKGILECRCCQGKGVPFIVFGRTRISWASWRVPLGSRLVHFLWFL